MNFVLLGTFSGGNSHKKHPCLFYLFSGTWDTAALLAGNRMANLVGDFLTVRSSNCLAMLLWNLVALLPRHQMALLLRHIHAVLFRHRVAVLGRHHLALLLRHVVTLLLGHVVADWLGHKLALLPWDVLALLCSHLLSAWFSVNWHDRWDNLICELIVESKDFLPCDKSDGALSCSVALSGARKHSSALCGNLWKVQFEFNLATYEKCNFNNWTLITFFERCNLELSSFYKGSLRSAKRMNFCPAPFSENILRFFRKPDQTAPNLQWNFSDRKWQPPFFKFFREIMTKIAV